MDTAQVSRIEYPDWLQSSVTVLRRITNWGGDGYLTYLNVDEVTIEGQRATAKIQVRADGFLESGDCATKIELLPQYRINILNQLFSLDETIAIFDSIVRVHEVNARVIEFRELPSNLRLIEGDGGMVVQRRDNNSDLVFKAPFEHWKDWAIGSAEKRVFTSRLPLGKEGVALSTLAYGPDVTARTFGETLEEVLAVHREPVLV